MSEFQIDFQNGCCLVTPPRRIDVTNAPVFLEEMRASIRDGNTKLVIDLSDTVAIDSAALGAMVQLYKWLRVGEGGLSLLGASENIKRLLSLTRLDQVFSVHESLDEAVAELV